MLLYLASLKNADRPPPQKRLDGWLDRFDLSEWKTRKPEDSLSKGMAQKVAVHRRRRSTTPSSCSWMSRSPAWTR